MNNDEFILPKVEVSTLQVRVYEELKRALMAGRFAPGRSLSIRDLAERFGTSPMPVREALRQLVTEHALEQSGKRTLRVPTVSIRTMQELAHVRSLLEAEAVALATPRLSDSEIDTIDRLNREFQAARRLSDAHTASEHNREMHFAIYRASGSQTLLRAIEPLWLQSGPYVSIAYKAFIRENQAARRAHPHNRLIEALRRRDAVAAAMALRDDITHASHHYLAYLEAQAAPRAAQTGT